MIYTHQCVFDDVESTLFGCFSHFRRDHRIKRAQHLCRKNDVASNARRLLVDENIKCLQELNKPIGLNVQLTCMFMQ